MKDCYMCTDDGYKVNREGYTLCKQHYEEVENVFTEHPADKDDRLYHEEQDHKAMRRDK